MGSSTVTLVGPPGGLDKCSVPSTVEARCLSPSRPVPRDGSAPPRAVIGDTDTKKPGPFHIDFDFYFIC